MGLSILDERASGESLQPSVFDMQAVAQHQEDFGRVGLADMYHVRWAGAGDGETQ